MARAGLVSKFEQHEIDAIFKNGRCIVKTEDATILAAPAAKDFARILLIASRKTGNSVQRHLLRRRIKSVFFQEKMYAKLGHDIIFIAKKSIMQRSFQEIKDLLFRMMQVVS
jgi:ribonuclease P protein component